MSTIATSLLDGLLEPFVECLTEESARRVTEFRVGAATQARLDDLAERANEGLLTEEERTAYASFIEAADLIAIMQLKAQDLLEKSR